MNLAELEDTRFIDSSREILRDTSERREN